MTDDEKEFWDRVFFEVFDISENVVEASHRADRAVMARRAAADNIREMKAGK